MSRSDPANDVIFVSGGATALRDALRERAAHEGVDLLEFDDLEALADRIADQDASQPRHIVLCLVDGDDLPGAWIRDAQGEATRCRVVVVMETSTPEASRRIFNEGATAIHVAPLPASPLVSWFGLGRFPRLCAQRTFHFLLGDLLRAAENQQPLHEILQLPHVARPRIVAQKVLGRQREAAVGQIVLLHQKVHIVV